jgi:hypothetical protein
MLDIGVTVHRRGQYIAADFTVYRPDTLTPFFVVVKMTFSE